MKAIARCVRFDRRCAGTVCRPNRYRMPTMARFGMTVLFGSVLGAAHAQQSPCSWRGIDGSGVFPAQGIVTEFHDLAFDVVTSVKDAKKGERKLTLPGAPGSRKNIVWRTTLPHWGQNTPVAVQDRVFVLCEEGWKSDAPLLVCLDVKDGKILWQEPVDHLDAWPFDSAQGGPADKAKVAKETRAKHLRYWREAMIWWNRLYWDNANNRFLHVSGQKCRERCQGVGCRHGSDPDQRSEGGGLRHEPGLHPRPGRLEGGGRERRGPGRRLPGHAGDLPGPWPGHLHRGRRAGSQTQGHGVSRAEAPTGEIAERHIAGLGWPGLAANNSGLACWGNRIFIRDNDYIWCVGNPAEPWRAPEECMK